MLVERAHSKIISVPVSHLGLEAMTTGSFSGVCAGGGYAPSCALKTQKLRHFET